MIVINKRGVWFNKSGLYQVFSQFRLTIPCFVQLEGKERVLKAWIFVSKRDELD